MAFQKFLQPPIFGRDDEVRETVSAATLISEPRPSVRRYGAGAPDFDTITADTTLGSDTNTADTETTAHAQGPIEAADFMSPDLRAAEPRPTQDVAEGPPANAPRGSSGASSPGP